MKQQKANALNRENYRCGPGAKVSSHLLIGAIVAALGGGLLSCAAGSEIGSIGAVLGRDEESNELYVREVSSGSAPSEPGLMVGDEIVMIDGVFVRGLSKNDLRLAMRGQVGSTVRVTVVRGAQVEHLNIKRTAIKAAMLPRREERISEQ